MNNNNNNRNKRRRPLNFIFDTKLSFRDFPEMISNAIKERKTESPEERKDDYKALILTVVIVSILIFIFWKVPFLHKIIFP